MDVKGVDHLKELKKGRRAEKLTDCASEAIALRGYIHAKAILFLADGENDVEHVVFGFVLHILINELILLSQKVADVVVFGSEPSGYGAR